MPNRTSAYLAAALTLLAAVAAFGRPYNGDQQLLLYIRPGEPAWNDSQLADLLLRTFSRSRDLRVIRVPQQIPEAPPFPGDIYDVDSLSDWALEVNGRYLGLVLVDDERLERRKGFHVPLVFHKYETVGVIEGEVRLLDVSRRRLLVAEPFRVELTGPRAFQATMDDDINDPDLHLTAPDKKVFFERLEEKLCRHIRKKFGGALLMR